MPGVPKDLKQWGMALKTPPDNISKISPD